MFRYSLDSHIELQWLELFSEFSIIWEFGYYKWEMEEFLFKENSLHNGSLICSPDFLECQDQQFMWTVKEKNWISLHRQSYKECLGVFILNKMML